MKKITISELKTNAFNPVSIVEGMVSVDSSDIRKMQREVDEALLEAQSLKEAIFYKIEKTRKRMEESGEESQMYRELESALRGIELSPLGDSSKILEKRNEIVEMKRIKRVLKYSIELEESREQVLDSLLNSESPEDWELLAELIYVHLHAGDQSASETFMKFSKRIEEKMVREFQESLAKNGTAMCRSIFEVLATLSKEFALVDQFLLSKNLLSSRTHVHPPVLTTIDLDGVNMSESSFGLFVAEVMKTLEESKHQIFKIFGSDSRYIEYLFSRIYKTLIAMNLESFLNVSNPAIFLLCIVNAHTKARELGEFLTLTFSRFDYSSRIDEIFNQFVYKASTKETQLFDEVLNILILGAKSVSSFLLLGEKVSKSDDMVSVFERMLIVVNSMMIRSEMLYSDEDEGEILRYFGRRLCIIVDKTVSGDPDKMSVIYKLRRMHRLCRRFFGEKVGLLEDFLSKIVECISQAFEDKIEQNRLFFKGEVSNMFFVQKDGHKKMFEHLKRCLDEARILSAKNYILFSKRTLKHVYELLYKQIQLVSFGPAQSQHFEDCINDLVGYVSLAFKGTIENKFEVLRTAWHLVVVDQKHFPEMYRRALQKMSERELNDLIKCRSDKEAVMSMVFK